MKGLLAAVAVAVAAYAVVSFEPAPPIPAAPPSSAPRVALMMADGGPLPRSQGSRPSPVMPSLPPPSDWDAADRATRRLAPAAFGALPRAVRAEAERRRCHVPQAHHLDQPHNVIAGRFRGRAHREWALLCSRGGVSAVLVCRAAPPLACEELAPSADRHWLQMVGPGRIGFSRIVSKADAGNRSDGVTLPHDGIDDYYEGKASVVWSWDRGQWRRLLGAD